MDIDYKCKYCGETFKASVSREKFGRALYCSNQCKNDAIKERHTKQCEYCKKIFHYKKKDQRFCSSECSYKARSVGLVKRNVIAGYKKKPIADWRKKVCIICNKDFIAKTRNQKHCSQECYKVTKSERMRGEKNIFYKDGSSKNKKCYRGDDWHVIRKTIYARDRYRCRYCGKHCSGREIQCHHIVKYKESFDNSGSNLITLCNSCHAKVEQNTEYFNKQFFDNHIPNHSIISV